MAWAHSQLAAARQLVEQALASDLKTYDEDHPTVATRRNNLAGVLKDLGELVAALTESDQFPLGELLELSRDAPRSH